MKVTTEHIGKILYPGDNSYSQDLSNGESVKVNQGFGLAGGWNQESVPVKIILPVVMSVPSVFNELVVRDMVIVEYKSKLYLVLNEFTSQPIPKPGYFDFSLSKLG